MRFIENGPILPDDLLNAQDEGQVIFFCGAGVSIADAALPSFSGLAEAVLKKLGATEDSPAKKLLIASQELENTHDLRGVLSADQIFGKLSRSFDSHDINRVVAESLRPRKKSSLPAHKTILKLARLKGGQTRLVTTNFDLLFEEACKNSIESRTRSNLPRIEYSDNDWGIIHLHGRVKPDYSGPDSDGFVLSSAEFGDAYLAQGWARSFVQNILDRYIAVFIGYSADDPPIRYLLEGLQQTKSFKNKLYAFQAENDDEAVAQWDDKGVESIIYELGDNNDHSPLWNTLEAWAARSKDPTAWKQKVLKRAKKGPTKLLPHERGMVAHLVKSLTGARAFAQETPAIPAEWLCVFDESIRLKQPEKNDPFFSEEKIINPYQLYSLDDDPPPSGRNETYSPVPIETWSAFRLDKKDLDSVDDKNLSSISGFQASTTSALVPRLSYITQWIGQVSHQRIAIWWAGQQRALHPTLIKNVLYKASSDKDGKLTKEAKIAWNIILELNSSSEREKHDGYEFLIRVKSLGWNTTTAREYVSLFSPFLHKGTLYRSIPRDNREKFEARAFVKADIRYPEGMNDVLIPDEYLPKIINGLRFNIEKAVDMKLDYSYWLDLCSIEPEDDDDDEQRYERRSDISGYVLHFVSLYKRLVQLDIKAAKQEYKSWRYDPIFIRLRIWACGQDGITDETEFMKEILSLEGEDFWSFKGERDLLLCLKKNWSRLSENNRSLIETKIMEGPPRPKKISQQEHASRSAHGRLNRLHWLNDNGCPLILDLDAVTTALQADDPDWKPEYARKAAESNDGRSGWVKTDTDWTLLKNTPLSEILSKSENTKGRDYSLLVEYAPFSGLCDDAPLRAIGALSLELKTDNFREKFWETFLSRDKRKDDSLRLKLLIGGRISQIPNHNFKEILLTASRWYEKVGPELRQAYPDLFHRLWDKFIETIAANEESSASALVRQKGKDIDWTMEAINSPSGNLAQLHMTDPSKDRHKNGKGYPKDWLKGINQLLALPGDPHRYAMVIFSFNLSWFYSIDPKWTSSHILKVLESEDSNSLDREAIWAGFMWGAKIPQADLFMRLKPLLLSMAHDTPAERKVRHTEILAGLLLAGWGSKDSEKKRYISDEEFRNVLLNSEDSFRTQVLWNLEKWSGGKKLQWDKKIIPFLKHVWPKHKKVRTAKASARLCDIALAQETNFPAVSKLVSQLVSKISNEHFYLPEMKRSGNDLASKYPEELLDLLYAILPERPERWPYGTQEALKGIEISMPQLLNDPRLIELKSRLNDS